jgi:hypothetical protein
VSLVVVAGGKRAPGATTTAVGLAAVWPSEERLLVEADPDGGVLAARFGLAYEPGLVSLAAATRRELSESELVGHTQRLEGGLMVLCAPNAPDQVQAALDVSAGVLAARLAVMPGMGVFVDVGRAWPTSAVRPLVEAADAVIVVCRPHLDELTQLVTRWRAFVDRVAPVGVVLVGDRPYSAREVAEVLDGAGPDPVWATVPLDGFAAELLNAERSRWGAAERRLRVAPLVRALNGLASDLVGRLGVMTSHRPALRTDGDGALDEHSPPTVGAEALR